MESSSTIYAIATAQGKAGIGVIRVSGPKAFAAAETLCGSLPPLRRTSLRTLKAADGTLLDRAIVVLFPKDGSYTGEQIVEFQCHGAPAVLNAILEELSTQPGLRPAEPGEFTRRALLNDRMDLIEVEGLADMLDAETEVQRRQAWRVYDGEASKIVYRWRDDLIRALAIIEANIDFSDEDLSDVEINEAADLLDSIYNEAQQEINGFKAAEQIKNGFEVAIVGPPNIGKSTLLNFLAKRDAAITSNTAGTTRDVIEVRMDLHGVPVTFLDTAGIRESKNDLEIQGIHRSIDRASMADLRVILYSKTDEHLVLEPCEHDYVVLGHGDNYSGNLKSVSGLTGRGVDDLIRYLVDYFSVVTSSSSIFGRHRQQRSLLEICRELQDLQAHSYSPLDVVAFRLWRVVSTLEQLALGVDIENVLDELFGRFCIGK